MSDLVYIGDTVTALCEALGVDKRNVVRIDIRPADITLDTYEVDEDGKPYFNDDGRRAMRRLHFKVRT